MESTSGSESPAPVVRKKPKKITKTASRPAPEVKPTPDDLNSDSLSEATEDLGQALEPVNKVGGATDALTGDEPPAPKLPSAQGSNVPAKLGNTVGGRRKVPAHMTRKDDDPVQKEDEKQSLKIKIELDLEVEVELWARVKGDVTIGLL